MDETGIVLAVQGEALKISMIRTEACAKCRACIAGMTQQEMIIYAKNDCGAKPGDQVVIALGEGTLLSAALIVYGIPCLFLLGGFFLSDWLLRLSGMQNYEVISFFAGILCLLVSYFLISKRESSFKSKKYEPVATKIV
ncbi:MAG: SoxR reducing system RseC family protein [Clostridiales bacterium]|nr:SoxR reducing system RseC family protein [Clostridiales bacterium]